MIPRALDAAAYRTLAELHRPQAAQDFAPAARALAEQGLRPHDIAQALRLTVAAVLQLLDHHHHDGGPTMKPDSQPEPSDLEKRTAAQEQHARDARANVEKSRQPSEFLTKNERLVLERSKGAA